MLPWNLIHSTVRYPRVTWVVTRVSIGMIHVGGMMVAHRMIIMLPLVAIKRLRWNALILWMVHHIIRVTHVRGIRIILIVIFWVIAHMGMVRSLLVHLRIHGRVV